MGSRLESENRRQSHRAWDELAELVMELPEVLLAYFCIVSCSLFVVVSNAGCSFSITFPTAHERKKAKFTTVHAGIETCTRLGGVPASCLLPPRASAPVRSSIAMCSCPFRCTEAQVYADEATEALSIRTAKAWCRPFLVRRSHWIQAMSKDSR